MLNSGVNSDLGIRLVFVLFLLGTQTVFDGRAEGIERHSGGLNWRSPVEGTHKSAASNIFEYGDERAINEDNVDIEEDWVDYENEADEGESLSTEVDKDQRNDSEQQGISKNSSALFVPGCTDCKNSTKLIQRKGLPNDSPSKNFKDISDITNDIKGILAETVNRTTNSKQEKGETREYALYLFQGQYMVEPRLNRFIDGAIRNMVSEMKIDVMDPLFFRVLPRGQVVSRLNPKDRLNKNKVQLSRPAKRRRRRRPFRRRRPGGTLTRIKIRVPKEVRVRRPNSGKNRKPAVGNKRQRGKQQQRRNQNRRRRQNSGGRGVGSGRVEGLSKITRDGDAEMQMFGNYTMIRSHQKIGPVVLNMQFRTKRGIRSTGATLPELKVHTVTRVSNLGSEMVDFVLDRPHAETIQLRGKLFPLAERVAKNIFARLFQPGSFMVARIREKVGVSLLSKPRTTNDGY